MDVQKQVDYWRTSGEEDMAAAMSLLEEGHLRHALFFAHLAIEKEIKACVVRRTCSVPPWMAQVRECMTWLTARLAKS